MVSLKDKNYIIHKMEAVDDCSEWDSNFEALSECYQRALDDRNKDVKEAILEFENWIFDIDPNCVKEESKWITFKKFKEIFGDWKK